MVTPSLNAERFFEETLESIWGQRSQTISIDHVVVDGGSTDATVEIASRYPSRTVVSTDDQGMYDAAASAFVLAALPFVEVIALNSDCDHPPWPATSGCATGSRTHG